MEVTGWREGGKFKFTDFSRAGEEGSLLFPIKERFFTHLYVMGTDRAVGPWDQCQETKVTRDTWILINDHRTTPGSLEWIKLNPFKRQEGSGGGSGAESSSHSLPSSTWCPWLRLLHRSSWPAQPAKIYGVSLLCLGIHGGSFPVIIHLVTYLAETHRCSAGWPTQELAILWPSINKQSLMDYSPEMDVYLPKRERETSDLFILLQTNIQSPWTICPTSVCFEILVSHEHFDN